MRIIIEQGNTNNLTIIVLDLNIIDRILKSTFSISYLIQEQIIQTPQMSSSSKHPLLVPAVTFQLYPKRFFIATLFCIVQMMTSIVLNTMTAIAAYLVIIYDLEPFIVNLGALLFTLMHPLFTFPAAYVIDTYGTRVGITIGCILGLLGVCLRMLVNHGFAWVIVGQVIAGIGRPFILNTQAKVSANWFSAQTRGSVTQLFMLVLNTSLIIGIFIPGIIFGSYKPIANDSTSIDEGKSLTFSVMFIQSILAAVCFGLNIIFQDDKPPTPPSASSNVVREPFSIAIPQLLSKRNYILLVLAFGCYFGVFNAISIVLSFILQPWFRGDELPLAVGLVGGSPIISGTIGVIVIGGIQRKSKQFKKFMLICMAGSSLAILLFFPMLETNSLFWASLISAFNSFFLFPLVPIMLEMGCQIAFPVGQGSAVGLLLANGNLFGALLGMIMSLIIQGETKAQTAGGLAFCFGIFIMGFFLIFFMKEELNRFNYQNRPSEKTAIPGSESETSNRQSQISSGGLSIDFKKEKEANQSFFDQSQNSIL